MSGDGPPKVNPDDLLVGDRWRNLDDSTKLALRNRLAEKLAAQGIASCKDEDPGAMALRLDRRVVQRPHLEKIDLAFKEALLGHVDRVLITTPPQVGKSMRAGVWGPFWFLAHRPRSRVIVASYGSGLANARGRAVRGLVQQHGAPFGLNLDPRTTAANDWMLTSGGGMRAIGVGGGLTGHPADIGIVDDPHKDRAEADSPTIRENIAEWWSSAFISRLAPGAPAILIMTRWHPDDIAGRLLLDEGRVEEGGRWRVVDLPALAVDHPRYEDGEIKCACDPDRPHDPLGRLPGDPLPHPRLEIDDTAALLRHWEDKRRSSTTRDWAALYQADPVPAEGALLDAQVLRRQRHYDDDSVPMRTAVAVDPGGGGRDEVGLVAGSLRSDRRLYWTHDRSRRMKSEVWGREACLLAHEVQADAIVVERNFGGDQARTIIGMAWEALKREGQVSGLKPRIVEVHARKGKLLRAEPVAQAVIEDKVRLGASLPDVESEWMTWQPGSPWSPGRIDATTYLTYELLPMAAGEATIVNPAGRSRAATQESTPLTVARVPRGQRSLPPNVAATAMLPHLRVVKDSA